MDSHGKKAGKGPLIAEEVSATISVTQDQYLFQPVVCHAICMATQQGGAEIAEDLCPTITASAWMSGNNQPVVCYVDTSYADDVVRISDTVSSLQSRDYKGGKLVAYSIENHPADSRVGIDDSGKVQTLTSRMGTGGNNVPLLMQLEKPKRVAYATGNGQANSLNISEKAGALDCMDDANGAQRMPDKENFNCVVEQEDHMNQYIVRRLTPTECCRLQGFPDGWGEIDHKDDFTEEEYEFWHEVRNTHATIMGKAVKNYTKEQMLTWYNKLHTDAAEYKMWGNGISLPTAMYVLQGIAIELEKQEKENE